MGRKTGTTVPLQKVPGVQRMSMDKVLPRRGCDFSMTCDYSVAAEQPIGEPLPADRLMKEAK